MWPTLLNLSRDECRRTLRRLELDAYSNMINVFRAQGALEDNRKKLLEELRAVLHISSDRHNAEARRVSNDELLATIAEQLTGPNTGLGWICEGRRRIPLLPRGIAQTMYTEIADNIKGAADNENTEMENKQLEAEQLAAPRTEEQELTDTEGMTAECTQGDEPMEEMYPLATEDQSSKIWETELICRKRKITEGGTTPEDMSTPVKNMRNIPANSNQKHLNLSQIYSKYSQPATSKSSSQSKHSYNQVSKVSTSKSSQHPTRVTHKHRAHRQSSKNPTQVMSKSHKKSQELSMSPGKQYNPTSMHLEYAGAPNSFQATYAQSILGSKKPDFMDDMKPKVLSSPGMVSDSPTMQLLTQPATVPHELGVSDNAHPDDHASLQAQSTPVKQQSAKPCHLILKKRSDVTHPAEKKVQMPEFKILQKPDGVKVISSRQVVVAPSSTHKVVNTTAKIGTTKIIGSLPKSRPSNPHNMISEKMIVVSKPSSMDNRIMSNSKIIVTSSAVNTHSRETKHVSTNSLPPRSSEQTLTAKGIPATDLKVSAKTFVLNPKSGQKMVVLPAKNRTKTGKEGQMPLLHFKGIPTAMKLVPVTSQHAQPAKTSAVTVVSRPAAHALPSTKIVSVEPIKTANLADIVPVKGLAPVTTPKITNPIVRPGSAKGGLIVVQKGTTIGKTLKFTKNGNDTKIIMGKNVNQLLQAAKPEQAETGKSAGNVIVLELNNEQSAQPTTMSEILDSRGPAPRVPEQGKPAVPEITQDTPVLFDSQLAEDTCNANSMDSTCGSLGDIVPMEDSTLRITDKDEVKASLIKDGKDSCVTDWEMELDTVSKKGKDDDDKLNSLHLDLGMSSDSESEFMVDPRRRRAQGCPPRPATTEHNEEIFSSTRGFSLATRTLLSQLQDDGSSSNDSSFALKSKCLDKAKKIDKIDKSESEALVKAKEKLSEKVAEPTSQQKRIDIYSTAITSTDMNLDPFSYLDEGMLVGDDVFESRRERRVEDQLGRLLADDSANSTDSQAVSESLPFTK